MCNYKKKREFHDAGTCKRSSRIYFNKNNNRGKEGRRDLEFYFCFVGMATLSSFIVVPKNPKTHFLSGSSLMPMEKCLLKISSGEQFPGSSFRAKTSRNQALVIRAGGDGGRSSGGSIFIGGFVLGGVIVGALGCLYAPQISKVLAGADSKDLMRKLPKFVYDEDKALEKTRKVLTEKIALLNSAIDGVSAQLKSDGGDPDEMAVNSEEMEPSLQ
ncbi:hypothetical protein VNO80_09190 [Phaseolus coccineus]|uniref:Uncharacterized protein n=1 Tax=Phaseolus coccineus TaxID=3886 RepID=A0AAN9N7H9_PHACN